MASKHANVGKSALLDWINTDFSLSYKKIEECGTAALYCQVFDKVHPGLINMDKVNFNAKLEHESIPNYKVLQNAFTKQGINKVVDVTRLVKMKFQDNLEFLQWVKQYHDDHCSSKTEYNAQARRSHKGGSRGPGSRHPAVTAPRAAARQTPVVPSAPRTQTRAPAPGVTPAKPRARAPLGSATKSPTPEASAKLDLLSKRVSSLKSTLKRVKSESMDIFDVLREVEIVCQNEHRPENEAFRDAILAILYEEDPTNPNTVDEDAPLDAPVEDPVEALYEAPAEQGAEELKLEEAGHSVVEEEAVEDEAVEEAVEAVEGLHLGLGAGAAEGEVEDEVMLPESELSGDHAQ